MDYLPEFQRLDHQLELARRAIGRIGDRETVQRLQEFARDRREIAHPQNGPP